MSKNMVEPESTRATWRLRLAYWMIKATRAQAHSCARASTPAYPPTLPSTPLHTRTHARTHTHTEICNTDCYPQQQWFRERVSMLRYT